MSKLSVPLKKYVHNLIYKKIVSGAVLILVLFCVFFYAHDHWLHAHFLPYEQENLDLLGYISAIPFNQALNTDIPLMKIRGLHAYFDDLLSVYGQLKSMTLMTANDVVLHHFSCLLKPLPHLITTKIPLYHNNILEGYLGLESLSTFKNISLSMAYMCLWIGGLAIILWCFSVMVLFQKKINPVLQAMECLINELRNGRFNKLLKPTSSYEGSMFIESINRSIVRCHNYYQSTAHTLQHITFEDDQKILLEDMRSILEKTYHFDDALGYYEPINFSPSSSEKNFSSL